MSDRKPWICSRCSASLAPHVDECPKCAAQSSPLKMPPLPDAVRRDLTPPPVYVPIVLPAPAPQPSPFPPLPFEITCGASDAVRPLALANCNPGIGTETVIYAGPTNGAPRA